MATFTDQGAVLYVAPHQYAVLRYKGNLGVYVPIQLFNGRHIDKHDIYQFTATEFGQNRIPGLQPEVKWKADRIKLLKKPRTIQGDGIFSKLDEAGEFGFIKFALDGMDLDIYCTRITVKPDCPNMNRRFTKGGSVRFVAIEQPPSGQQNVKWRTLITTDTSHKFNENLDGVIPLPKTSQVARPTAAPVANGVVRTTTTTVVPSASAAAPWSAVPSAASSDSGSVSAQSSQNQPAPLTDDAFPDLSSLVLEAASGYRGPPMAQPVPHPMLANKDHLLPPFCREPAHFAPGPAERRRARSTVAAVLTAPIEAVWEEYLPVAGDPDRPMDEVEVELSKLMSISHYINQGDCRICQASFF